MALGRPALNIVATFDGNFWGETLTSRSISNELDHQALLALRDQADFIVTSATTARAENYRRTNLAQLVIYSAQNNFVGIPAVWDESAGPTDSKVFLCSSHQPARELPAWVEWISFDEMVATLRRTRAVVESGPTLAARWISSGLIAEIALNVVLGTELVGDPYRHALSRLGAAEWSLTFEARVNDTLFSRWQPSAAWQHQSIG